MKARQLQRRAEALAHLVGRVRALRTAADGRHMADAERALLAELALVREEHAAVACPQRARHIRNGTREEWDQVRRNVRGLAEGQLVIAPEPVTVGELTRAELRQKGIRA